MTPKQFTAEPYFRPADEDLRFLPEGPRVLPNALLGWVAIQHGPQSKEGSFNLLDLGSRVNRRFRLHGRPGFFAETTQPGLLLVGLERSLVYFDLTSGSVKQTLVQITADERVIINDGLAVEGGVLFGTKHLGCTEPLGALYYFDSHTHELRVILDRQYCSNGKFLQRDASRVTLFDIDSIPKTLTRYRFDSRLERIVDQSLVAPIDTLPGIPDGMRPVQDGESAVVAFYNPGPVANGVAWQIRLADGATLCEWLIPGSPRVTCPEFVQIDNRVKILFTTADEGMPEGTRRLAPGAGTMYLADTPFLEMPAPPPLWRV